MELRAGRHVVSCLHAHIVFVPRYRKRIFDADALERMRAIFRVVCADFETDIKEFNGEADHIHLLVTYPPKIALSGLVNSLKGASARRLRAAHLPEVERRMWGAHFWSPSYCAVSCGGAPLAVVKRYVEAQRGGASSPS